MCKCSLYIRFRNLDKFGRLLNEYRCFYIFESFVVCLILDERDVV